MSERIRASKNLLNGAGEECFDESREDNDEGVRQPSAALPPAPFELTLPSQPAHRSNRLIAQLNRNWRVVDDPLQWILQRRKGNPRRKNSGWKDRSFCTTREGLLRCVREYCGQGDQNAVAALLDLPANHVNWEGSK
jgi:hypothetical protein